MERDGAVEVVLGGAVGVLDEVEALRRAVSQMVKGEVIVLFYEKLQPVEQALREYAAQPVVALPPALKRLNRPTPARPRIGRRIGRTQIPASPAA